MAARMENISVNLAMWRSVARSVKDVRRSFLEQVSSLETKAITKIASNVANVERISSLDLLIASSELSNLK